ncbi:MAG: hypothetical protein KUG73_15485 [Pseudomonadales bacterium]|nr:hypothetical protein [Pseudomonadales bacterium]
MYKTLLDSKESGVAIQLVIEEYLCSQLSPEKSGFFRDNLIPGLVGWPTNRLYVNPHFITANLL